MLSNSKNVAITGKYVNLNSTTIAGQAIDEGLKILYEHAAPGALHDSGERFDPPNCHPGTRVEVQESIIAWLDDADSEYSAMWMNGAMGAGKSAIGQAIANLCHQRGQLSSSFFFARASEGRNDETRLVATLAYQMTIHIPDTRSPISAAILTNPLIFKSSLKSQIESLIVRPLLGLSSAAVTTTKPILIIIDGLDECLHKEAQALIIQNFVCLITSIHHIPVVHKVLIISRPESNIDAAFRNPSISSHVKHLSLNELWKPDDDIRAFLVDSFADIKLTHPLGKLLPSIWPPIGAIGTLIGKSSGQFIYAAVVMRFLRSHRNHPVRSLDVILGLIKDTRNQHYAELDALYAHIFSKVDDLDLVLQILSVHLSLSCYLGVSYCASDCNIADDILDLPSGSTQLALNDLVSAVQVTDEGQINILHASLSEFLMDQARSGSLYVCTDKTGIDVVNFALSHIERASSQMYPDDERMTAILMSIDIVGVLIGHISLQGQIKAFEAIAEREIFGKITSINARQPHYTPITEFIELFPTKRSSAPSELHIPLTKCFQQIKDWSHAQISAFTFSDFDNNIVDVLVFRGLWARLSLPVTLPPINLPPYCDPLILTKLLAPSSIPWRSVLMQVDADLLSTTELLGEYAPTRSRRLCAALRTCRQLLTFTNQDFMQAISGSTYEYHQEFYISIVCDLLSDTPPNQELYTVLEPMMSEEAPATCVFPTSRFYVPKLSATVLRVYGYFWRKYQFEELYYGAIMRLACGISEYLEKTHESMPELICRPPPKNEQRVTVHQEKKTRKRDHSPESEDPSKRRRSARLN